MNLVQLARSTRSGEKRYSLEQWANDVAQFVYNGLAYQGIQQTYSKEERPKERSESPFDYWVRGAYKNNGVVFACQVARLLLFTEARFQFQALSEGSPGDLFGSGGDPRALTTRELRILENPWPNGSTGELLARMLQDVDLAGNAYVRRTGPLAEPRLERLRPDWVDIVLKSSNDLLTHDVAGYIYYPSGPGKPEEGIALLREEVAHWSPIPDPVASYRGMSWLSPVIREVRADVAATSHKQMFFDNGATPNMIVKLPDMSLEKFRALRADFDAEHTGAANAYKTLFLGGGADATVVGRDFRQMDFKQVQGAGEPLALDTPIPTPSGWTTIGKIKPGDQVFGRDGLPADVLGVSPVHVGRRCYRVTFNDRSSIVADGQHLWTARDRNTAKREERDYTTEELRVLIQEWTGGGNRIAITAPDPLKLPEKDLLLDPYVLGAWLGDGHTSGAAICGAHEDLVFIADEIEQRGYTVTRWKEQPDKCSVIGLPGGVLAALRALGVLGSKHIPDDYLRSSVEQRLDLLRGLMDTDGSVGARGKETCEFSSKYEALATQVAELARSLGYRTTVSAKVEPRSRTGETWRVTFRADPQMVPFLLPRKAQRCITPLWVKNRAVVSIEPVASVPVRCIQVATSDHLFLAGPGMIPTHNTRIAAAAGVPPVIVGLSEGLQAATYSNYAQARRRFADMTIRPLWRSCAAALATIVRVPANSRLWYDDRDIPALQEDEKDAAEIESVKATTITALVREGFTAESAVAAVMAKDMSLLKHTGALSVQLTTPGSNGSTQNGSQPAEVNA